MDTQRSTSANYEAGWAIHARAWRRSVLAWGLAVPACFGLSAVIGHFVPDPSGWVVAGILGVSFAPPVLISQSVVRAPCPRCGEPFHATKWVANGFARRCPHCGLRKWARTDAESL